MHERQAIREAVVAQLKGVAPNYRTSAGPRITSSRVAPTRMPQLPTINVSIDSESIDPASANSSPRELQRTAIVAIEAWVADSSELDNRLDDIALEIEAAMDVDLNLAGTAFTSVLQNTDTGMSALGEREIGVARLEYAITYHSQIRTELPTAKFNTADVHVDLDGNQAAADQPHDFLTGINQEP